MSASEPLPEGESASHLAIRDHEGQVVLVFPKPTLYMTLEPATAVEVGKTIIDAAVHCGARVTINAPRPKVLPEVRARMTARALHVLTNKRGAAEKDAILAVRLVDTLLNMLDL